jgi:hypothetical protein
LAKEAGVLFVLHKTILAYNLSMWQISTKLITSLLINKNINMLDGV